MVSRTGVTGGPIFRSNCERSGRWLPSMSALGRQFSGLLLDGCMLFISFFVIIVVYVGALCGSWLTDASHWDWADSYFNDKKLFTDGR